MPLSGSSHSLKIVLTNTTKCKQHVFLLTVDIHMHACPHTCIIRKHLHQLKFILYAFNLVSGAKPCQIIHFGL